MRSISELRGLRFPDEFVVKMFFKEQLQRAPGRVAELGCGPGNNLMLFAEFGWDVTGLDYSDSVLADARHNLAGAGTLIQCDLVADFPAFDEGTFDAILMPSVNYYLPRASFVRLLEQCRNCIKPRGMFFIRSRLPEDWRWGRGKAEGPGAFRLECRETGEYGLLNVFYSADELSGLIREHFGELQQSRRLTAAFDNPQGGIVVRNADVIIWGRAGAT
jgi:SAM-dependent methyltransferase